MTRAKMGATVLLHGRSRERAEVTLQEIFAATGSDRLEYYLADFSSLADVRRLAEAVRSQHGTLNTLTVTSYQLSVISFIRRV